MLYVPEAELAAGVLEAAGAADGELCPDFESDFESDLESGFESDFESDFDSDFESDLESLLDDPSGPVAEASPDFAPPLAA